MTDPDRAWPVTFRWLWRSGAALSAPIGAGAPAAEQASAAESAYRAQAVGLFAPVAPHVPRWLEWGAVQDWSVRLSHAYPFRAGHVEERLNSRQMRQGFVNACDVVRTDAATTVRLARGGALISPGVVEENHVPDHDVQRYHAPSPADRFGCVAGGTRSAPRWNSRNTSRKSRPRASCSPGSFGVNVKSNRSTAANEQLRGITVGTAFSVHGRFSDALHRTPLAREMQPMQ